MAKTAPKLPALGRQTLLDLHECDAGRISDVPWVKRSLVEAVRAAGGTVVRTVFHRFKPWGVSGVVIIAESHLAIHTWPEHGYAAIDLFTCSPKLRHAEIGRRLKAAFGAKALVSRPFLRGRVAREESGLRLRTTDPKRRAPARRRPA